MHADPAADSATELAERIALRILRDAVASREAGRAAAQKRRAELEADVQLEAAADDQRVAEAEAAVIKLGIALCAQCRQPVGDPVDLVDDGLCESCVARWQGPV